MQFFGRDISRYIRRIHEIPSYLGYFLKCFVLFKDPLTFISAYLLCKAPCDKVVELRSGLKIYLSEHPHDVISVFVIFVREDYGRIQPGDVVVDIGANIGVFALYAAHNQASRVFAYEPNSEAFHFLLQNIRANNLERIIIPWQFAVVGTPGDQVRFPTRSSVYNAIITNEDDTNFEWVNTIALPEILGQTGNVNLLKLDCEGAEYDILAATDEESYGMIQNIKLEYHSGLGPDIENHLTRNGFFKRYFKAETAVSGTMWYEKNP